MSNITYLLLLLITVTQSIKCFCVYNKLEENIGVYIVNKRSDIPGANQFSKGLNAYGDKECCPYTSSDCSRYKTKTHLLEFEFHFYSEGRNSRQYFFDCHSGGALIIRGNTNEFIVDCNYAEGNLFNTMEDGVGVYVMHEFHGMHKYMWFKKGLSNNGDKECCPYTSRHCTQERKASWENQFVFHFYYGENEDKFNSGEVKMSCLAGGYIKFTGNRSSYTADCYTAEHTLHDSRQGPLMSN
ncbi:hypothetical protein BDB01DRAFT_910001 [Pilobolus umbonatus]|nr:hypothetical protein BDB01DRAFT_910001 [Pilobolus umbonatus]